MATKPEAKKKGPTPRQLRESRGKARERFKQARKASTKYERSLKQVARQVGSIVNGLAPGGIVKSLPDLVEALGRYGDLLVPWAKAVASTMIAEVANRDEKAWYELARESGQTLRRELREAPTGEAMRQLLGEQVHLIKSIPLDAAQRVQSLAMEAMLDGSRASEVAKEIANSNNVSTSKAMLIARTETSKASSTLTEARAVHVGSEGYFWRTAHDGDVRPSHKAMEGKFVRWDEPPTLDGMVGHAGCFPNCRCWAEPVLPDVID